MSLLPKKSRHYYSLLLFLTILSIYFTSSPTDETGLELGLTYTIDYTIDRNPCTHWKSQPISKGWGSDGNHIYFSMR